MQKVREEPSCFDDLRFSAPYVVDWNRDGRLDLLLGAENGTVSYFERQADRSLQQKLGSESPFHGILAPGGRRSSPVAADWNGDGLMDLLLGGVDGSLAYYRQLDSGTLLRDPGPFRYVIAPGFALCKPNVADWNGDGKLDLLVGGASGKLSYFQQLDNGNLVEKKGLESPFSSFVAPGELEASPFGIDWDGDGDLDLLLGGRSGAVQYYQRQVDKSFILRTHREAPLSFAAVASSSVPCAANWDEGNDLPDLLLGGSNESLVVIRQPDDTLNQRIGRNNPFTSCDVVGGNKGTPNAVDWDSDGDLDLVVGSQDGTVYYCERDDADRLLQKFGIDNPFDGIRAPGEWCSAPNIVDWNRDGKLDLILGGWSGGLAYYERQANGSLQHLTAASPFFNITVSSLSFPFVADWDSDGHLDLLLGSAADGIAFFQGSPNASFHERRGHENPFFGIRGPGGERSMPMVVDWNGDHRLDLVLGGSDGAILYFQRQGDGTLMAKTGPSSPFAGISVAAVGGDSAPYVVDWDMDGLLDLILGSKSSTPFFYSAGICNTHSPCNGLGICDVRVNNILGSSCICLSGHSGQDCSLCAEGYALTVPQNGPRNFGSCQACGNCQPAAICMDDAYVMKAFSETNTSLLLPRGTAACIDCAAGYDSEFDANSCMACRPGYFRSAGTTAGCQPCPPHTISREDGSTQCSPCSSVVFFLLPNDLRTDCVPSFINLLLVVYFAAALTICMLLPCLLGLPLPISDIRSSATGVIVTLSCRHFAARRCCAPGMTAFFFNTGIPGLDRPEKKICIVKPLCGSKLQIYYHIEGRVAHKPYEGKMDSSSGYVRLSCLSAMRSLYVGRVPMFGLMWLAIITLTLLFTTAQALAQNATGVCVLGTVVSAMFHYWRWHKSSRTPLKLLLAQHKKDFEGRRPIRVSPGKERAIALSGVIEVATRYQSLLCDRTMYWIEPNLVKPLTDEHRCSYAEWAGPLQVDWYISHWWGGSFHDTVASLQKHAKSVAKQAEGEAEATAYWICTFSNNQWALHEELTSDPRQSSFYKALHSCSCRGTCMILDERVMPLSRIWCLFELLETFERRDSPSAEGVSKQFEGLFILTKSGVLNSGKASSDVALAIGKAAEKLHLEDAVATNPKDKEMIHLLVTGKPGGFQAMNWKLKSEIRAVLMTMRQSFQHEIGQLDAHLACQIATLMRSVEEELEEELGQCAPNQSQTS